MKKILLTTIFLLLSSKVFAGPIIEVDGSLYEMGTVRGLLSSHRSTIENQFWFGDSSLARDFANELGTQLNPTLNWGLGPAFGFEIYDEVGIHYTKSWFYKPTNYHLELDNRAQLQNAVAGVYYTYAVAEYAGEDNVPVPEPSTLILFSISALILISRKMVTKT